MLTFIDIYNETLYDAQQGDFINAAYQIGRLIRKILLFNSMSREALVISVKRLDAVVRLLASGPDGYIQSTVDALPPANPSNPWENKAYIPNNSVNRTDPVSRSISGVTGFIDGAFQAPNTSYCRVSLILFSSSLENFLIAYEHRNENYTVWYATRALKYMHPSLFHCFYSVQEAYETIQSFMQIDNYRDITYNLIYKTGQIYDQVRIINAIIGYATYYDRQVYVLTKAIGSILQLLISPTYPRKDYTQ